MKSHVTKSSGAPRRPDNGDGLRIDLSISLPETADRSISSGRPRAPEDLQVTSSLGNAGLPEIVLDVRSSLSPSLPVIDFTSSSSISIRPLTEQRRASLGKPRLPDLSKATSSVASTHFLLRADRAP